MLIKTNDEHAAHILDRDVQMLVEKWINEKGIDLFGDGIHAELSDEQLDQIEKMQNEKYGEVFIGRDNMYYVGERVYVDEYGNIYFECTHWEDNAFPEALGEAVLFFSYHSDTEEFNAVDMMYCPLYVYE
ncbi:MAG: hypothetical protein LUC90_02760 [Lachnospiraceae bacterium]|nr:hypothetical protein [Lachnospiraceae bacterium]